MLDVVAVNRISPLAAGEIVTAGTITDAWPVATGEVWSSEYRVLGLEGLSVPIAR
jgi:2-oxo-3-hexenedioate decarboxylase